MASTLATQPFKESTSNPDSGPAYSSRSVKIIGLCFVLSGATGLIYEVLWARMLGLVFGATTLAVSTVLAAFMGGLALGSLIAGRCAPLLKKPLRAYGLIEGAIAAYALLVPVLFRLVDGVYALVWQRWQPGFVAFSIWRFALSGAVLLLPAILMGATLPVLATVVLRGPAFKATSVTRLYTYNLSGAILGTVAAGFFLLPSLGLRLTTYVAAALNLVVTAVAILLERASGGLKAPANEALAVGEDRIASADPPEAKIESDAEGKIGFWLFCAFASGFVTISTQVAWTRVLMMIIGSSTYAFSIVLAIFLVGLSLGAYEVSRKDRPALRRIVFKVGAATTLSLCVSVFLANKLPWLLVFAGLNLKVAGWRGLLTLQILCAALLMLLPACLMGMMMPLVLAQASRTSARVSVWSVGRSYATNTVGAIAGAVAAGFVLVPVLGTRFTIVFAAVLCVIVAGMASPALGVIRDRDLGRALAVGATVVLVLILFVATPQLNLNELSIGAYDSLVRVLAQARSGVQDAGPPKGDERDHQLLFYREGPTATVSVRKDWGITSLAINGRTNASDGDMPTQIMLAQLPLLLAARTDNALIVGFASGVSAGAILQSPVKSVVGVELEPSTVAASRFFEHVNEHPLADSRFHLTIDDARTYLRVNPTRYDVIMSEPSHPWVPGVANLFTLEFFSMGHERLNDGGLFVQWLQTYQLSTASLQSVLATFQRVFPHVFVFRVGGAAKGKDLILVGSDRPLTLDRIAERLRDPRIAAELARIDLKTEADVRAWYICDETSLKPAVAGAVINTDDNMHVETATPREAFLPLTQGNAAWIDRLR